MGDYSQVIIKDIGDAIAASIVFSLAFWKVIDIVTWVSAHLQIRWLS